MALPIIAPCSPTCRPAAANGQQEALLTDILVLASCTVLGGCDTWDDIAEYAET